jgi:hypothetical protein
MLRHPLAEPVLCQTLASRGLECHLLTADSKTSVHQFCELLCDEIDDIARAAYGRELTPAHLTYETWAVTLREADGEILACATLCFYSDLPCYFKTHFESVSPAHQRMGLGRLLFECVTAWTRVLVVRDPLVIEGVMRSNGTYCIAATIDRDDEYDEDNNYGAPDDNSKGHGAFLKKLGFVPAVHDFRANVDEELVFQLEFHVPIHDSLEEEHALPARPSSA